MRLIVLKINQNERLRPVELIKLKLFRVYRKKSISKFYGQYPTFSVNKNHQINIYRNNNTLMSVILIITIFFQLMTFLGGFIEFDLQQGGFLENLMPTFSKKMKNKNSKLKMHLTTEKCVSVVKTLQNQLLSGRKRGFPWKIFRERPTNKQENMEKRKTVRK